MRRSGVFDLARLHQAFEKHGKHDRILDYLAQPRIELGSRNDQFISECKQHLESRTPFDQLPSLGFASQDSTVFKKRFDLMSTDNHAYVIATKANPTVPELEEFSVIEPGWSILFPLKIYLIYHSEQAKAYRGMLPFGSEVIKFYNEAELGKEIKGTPSFSDHVRLKEVTNALADHLGCTTVMLNNEMYLEGSRIKAE
jgi:hypothetical protein